ncbi:MAG: glutathione S-transferase N-terminal domain-containing protein [Nannocystaceae bacterium]
MNSDKTRGAATLSGDAALYLRSNCGHSRRASLALDNLHLRAVVPVHNISDDTDAEARLLKLGGKSQAPCLVLDGKALYEATDITRTLAERVAPVG